MSTANGKAPPRRKRRPIPANIEAERALLASVLLDPGRAGEHLSDLPPEAFHECANYAIACVIRSLIASGRPVDSTLVVAELDGATEFSDQSPAAYIASLFGETATAANAGHYARLVRDAWLRRRTLVALETGLEHLQTAADDDDFVGVLARTRNDLDEISAGDVHGFSIETITTLDLLDNSPRPTFLVEGVLVEGQPAVIGGAFKTLKTSIAVDLAISLATAGKFLGFFNVPRARRVGVVSGESGRHTLGETCDRICYAAGVDPRTELDNLVWSTSIPALTDPQHLAALRSFIIRHALDVLLADPWYLMAGAAADNASNVYSMGQVYAALGRIGADTGCTITTIHHTSRGASRERAFRPVELGDLAFAGVAEHSRQWLLVGRRSPYNPDSGLHELWLSVGGSAGHGGVWALDIEEGINAIDFGGRHWRTTIKRQEEADQERTQAREKAVDEQRQEKLERTRKDVVGALVKMTEGGATKTQIRERVGCSWSAIHAAVASLLDDGTLTETMIPMANKRSYEGYKLTDFEGSK